MATNPPKKTAAPAKKAPAKKKGNTGKAGRPAGLFTWVTIGIVVILVGVIVIVKANQTTSTSKTSFGPVSAQVLSEVTAVPTSVFNTVGVTSPDIAVNTPSVANPTSAALNWADAEGVKHPTIFYYGAEYCPYCAAERWAMITSLSRFGTFTGLQYMQSNPNDSYPNTSTFTFRYSSYKSKYVTFVPLEVDDANYKTIATPNAKEQAVLNLYNPSTPSQGSTFPFVSFDNKYILLGSQYTPGALAGLSHDQIAGALNDSTNLLTDGIISASNYFTASVCAADNNQPGSVCDSPGVMAAKSAMHIK